MEYRYNAEEAYRQVVGHKVVNVNATSEQADLTLDDGRVLSFKLEADCCSHSYYTEPTQFDEVLGTTLQGVEERHNRTEDIGKYDCSQWHFLVLITDKGHVTIDWRNDSNGYYDGNVVVGLEVPDAPASA